MSQTQLLEPLPFAGLSLEEWAALPDDQPGEWVNGRLEEEEVPDYIHEVVAALLTRALANWALPLGGMVATSGAKFGIDNRRGRMPDLTVCLPPRPLPPPRGLIRTPPDIAIEIVSPTPRDARRDRVQKVDDYAAFGVRFYWIVDPELRSLEILELSDDGRYLHALGATDGVLETVPGCPGLRLDLDEIWTMVDRVAAQPGEP